MDGFLLVAAISVATTGVAVALTRLGRGGAESSVVAPGLAAGVMVWLALAEVAPDASADLGWVRALLAMAAGAALVALVSRVAHRRVGVGVAPVIGVALVLHDLPEGFAVGAVVGGAGLVVALPLVVAVTAHNLPEKLAFVSPAAAEGRPLLPVVAAATLPEPLGAALAGAGSAAAPGVLAVTVAVAGGMMLAVAVGTLPTLARRARTMRPFLTAGLAGAASMAVLGSVLPA